MLRVGCIVPRLRITHGRIGSKLGVLGFHHLEPLLSCLHSGVWVIGRLTVHDIVPPIIEL
nr:MAG TPA: hypothetical protein [Bacteriophage sp.]